MTAYITSGGASRTVTQPYITVGGASKPVQSAYITSGGVSRLWFEGKKTSPALSRTKSYQYTNAYFSYSGYGSRDYWYMFVAYNKFNNLPSYSQLLGISVDGTVYNSFSSGQILSTSIDVLYLSAAVTVSSSKYILSPQYHKQGSYKDYRGNTHYVDGYDQYVIAFDPVFSITGISQNNNNLQLSGLYLLNYRTDIWGYSNSISFYSYLSPVFTSPSKTSVERLKYASYVDYGTNVPTSVQLIYK